MTTLEQCRVMVGKLVKVSMPQSGLGNGNVNFCQTRKPVPPGSYKTVWLTNRISFRIRGASDAREMLLVGVEAYANDIQEPLGVFLDPEFGWCISNLYSAQVEEVVEE